MLTAVLVITVVAAFGSIAVIAKHKKKTPLIQGKNLLKVPSPTPSEKLAPSAPTVAPQRAGYTTLGALAKPSVAPALVATLPKVAESGQVAPTPSTPTPVAVAPQLVLGAEGKAYIEGQLRSLQFAQRATLDYLKTFLYLATQSKITAVPLFERRLAEESEELRSFLLWVDSLKKGFEFGEGIGGVIGGVIGAVVAAVAGVVTQIFDVAATEEQERLLRVWMVKFSEFAGPPPSALLHLAEQSGSHYDAKDWSVGLVVHLFRLCLYAKKQGFNLDQANLLNAERLAKARAENLLNVLPDWSAWKPESRLGPWFSYAFHPEWTIGRLTGLDYGMKESCFYDVYRDCVHRNAPMQFSYIDFQTTLARSGLSTRSVLFFEIGNDPFYASDTVSMSSGFRQRIILPSYVTECWLTSPRGGK